MKLIIATIITCFFSQICYANEIYINQVGNNTDLTITQDGTDNVVSDGWPTNGKATISGNNASTTYTQTGDINLIGVYMSADNGINNTTQTGDDNEAYSHCYGSNCRIDITQTGDSNLAYAGLGDGGDTDQTATITQDGDNNLAYVKADGDGNSITVDQDGNNHMVYGYNDTPITGDRNTVTVTQNGSQYEQTEAAITGNDNTVDSYQGGNGESNFSRLILIGDDNNIKVWQGKQLDGYTDTTEAGDHDAYVTITGNNNTYHSAQTDQAENCCWASHEMTTSIEGDYNDVELSQRKNGAHTMNVDVDGDYNNVEAAQLGNSDTVSLDLDLTGDSNLVDILQHGSGGHSATVNLSSVNGPAYNFSLEQYSGTAKSYSITSTCVNPGGCSMSVSQY
jgi:hypothetical protein